ncbi:alcohol dehydrogenase catalytic domain-containing protein [Nonomuraea sp. CA-141351]|uniref:alcohol dehydrogenase catalytic domain-containing protein n=1 Tax=Nonomuraea sp. CA-141351 TaxID=3239996 RepID=UPI003D8DE077
MLVVRGEAGILNPGHVRLTIEACGVCRSDAAFVGAAFPNVPFPLVTGHEIAGRVDAVGDDVEGWQVGDRLAVNALTACGTDAGDETVAWHVAARPSTTSSVPPRRTSLCAAVLTAEGLAALKKAVISPLSRAEVGH